MKILILRGPCRRSLCLIGAFFISIFFLFSKNAGATNHLTDNITLPNVPPNAGIVIVRDPPVQGHLITRIKILTHNVYGLNKERCEERAETFGNRVAGGGSRNSPPGPYDIVSVQEFYEHHFFDFGQVCNDTALEDAIKSNGHYRNSDNTRIFTPRINSQHNGGVGIFTLHKIIQRGDWQWSNDQQPRFKAGEGFMFARIRIPNADITIDTYNVHLNSGSENRSARKKQLKQLADKIKELSQRSGNPVLLMGDFNIGGPLPINNPPGNDGYEDILEALHEPRDLWLEVNRGAPAKSGYTTGCWVFSGDANGCDGKQRIDYIFVPTHADLTNNPYQIVIVNPAIAFTGESRPGVSRVRWAKIGAFDPPVRYASDHFGVEALLDIRNKPMRLRGLDQKCLTVKNGIAKSGTPVQLFRCDSKNRNKWSIKDGEIRGIDGLCLDVPGGSTEIRTPLQIFTCNGSNSQRFDLGGSGELRSRLAPNLCVEVRGGFIANGTPVQTFTCNGTLSQKWTFGS